MDLREHPSCHTRELARKAVKSRRGPGQSGEIRRQWPLAGVPDATFFSPSSGLVHVAIGDPGLIQSIDPRTGASMQFITAAGAKTTALIEPDRLYVFSPLHNGILDLRGA